MLKRLLPALALWPVPALLGQFHNLVTNGDGSVLLFSSTLRMTGTDQPQWEKLFRIDSSGLSLFFERDKAVTADFSFLTNHYRAIDADMSGDGAVTAVVVAADCAVGGSSCFLGQPKNQSEIAPAAGRPAMTLQGNIRLSRNGRYALLCCDGAMVSMPSVRDLYSGQATNLSVGSWSSLDISARPIVASTGVAVLAAYGSLLLAGSGSVRQVSVAAAPAQALIDAAGATVVYAGTMATGGTRLARVDVATGAESPILDSPDLRLTGMSDRGDQIAFLRSIRGFKQLHVVRPDGTALRQLTADTAGIAEAALSGSGAVAFAVTGGGRILRIDVPSGAITELIGRTVTLGPAPNPGLATAIAGSVFCVSGTGLTETAVAAAPPLPLTLGGLELRLDGLPVPLASVAPGQACFQVPWETTKGSHFLTAASQANPFLDDPVAPVYLPVARDGYASFVRLGPEYPPDRYLQPYPLVAHGDFSGLVTPASPARAGEIVHLYMTGLGPVDPPVATGAPSPSDPPARSVLPFECHLVAQGGAAIPLDVLFAGLAPTFAGYYQVSLRLPVDVPAQNGEVPVWCSVGTLYAGESAWVPVARPQ
jgi:uncharacterized protein (TIGR03437 family)